MKINYALSSFSCSETSTLCMVNLFGFLAQRPPHKCSSSSARLIIGIRMRNGLLLRHAHELRARERTNQERNDDMSTTGVQFRSNIGSFFYQHFCLLYS